MKVSVTSKPFTSESRRKKRSGAGNARSQMLKLVMPLLSGDDGDALAKAVLAKNGAKVETLLRTIASKARKKVESRK